MQCGSHGEVTHLPLRVCGLRSQRGRLAGLASWHRMRRSPPTRWSATPSGPWVMDAAQTTILTPLVVERVPKPPCFQYAQS
jgi:hypothetical protein